MLTSKMRHGVVSAAVVAAAVSFAGAPGAQAATGYTPYGDGTRASVSDYTIKLASTGFNDPTRVLFQNAINQIHANTNIRITIAPGNTHSATPANNEIAVTLAAAGSTCGTATSWDGCGGPSATAVINGVSHNTQGFIKLKAGIFQKSPAYQNSLIAHELGQALGLDHHSGDAAQLMHPTVDSSDAGTYKAGDIAGLQHLGRLAPPRKAGA